MTIQHTPARLRMAAKNPVIAAQLGIDFKQLGPAPKTYAPLPCIYRGAATGNRVPCAPCKGSVRLTLYSCTKHTECTLEKKADGYACCNGCATRVAPVVEEPQLRWAYGITTVPQRRETLLVQTMRSLSRAGFVSPRLFVDGSNDPQGYARWAADRGFGDLEVTCRFPKIRTYGNWILSLAELYIRDPKAERYAIFQDDFVTYPNLKRYLNRCSYPSKGYWNLYTYPGNQSLAPRNRQGWYRSDQRGMGALALVFSQESVRVLLQQKHMIDRPLDDDKGWRNVDGGVVHALKKVGWVEYVHTPSLVQHTGIKSSMGHRRQPLARSFRGEEYDALDLLPSIETQR